MHAIQISDELKVLLDRLVAQGVGGSRAEVVDQAVRLCAAGLEDDDDALSADIEAGLADMQAGRFSTIDGPKAHQRFWTEVAEEVGAAVADARVRSGRSQA